VSRDRLLPLAAAAFALLMLGGCGSYTKRDFAARANAICVAAVRQERSLAPPSFTGSASHRSASLAAYLRRLLPIVDAESKQLRRLPRPSQTAHNRAALAAYLRAVTTTTAGFHALQAAAASGSPQRVTAAARALSSSDLPALAAAYGLRACASPAASIS
jgi:hypothetical protein